MQWLRNRLGAKLLGYERVWLRTCLVTKSPDFVQSSKGAYNKGYETFASPGASKIVYAERVMNFTGP